MSHRDVFKNNSVGINVQIRLDQFSGSPGVGLTEYYLAVSVPLLFLCEHHVAHSLVDSSSFSGRRLVGLTSPSPSFGGPFGVPSQVDSP